LIADLQRSGQTKEALMNEWKSVAGINALKNNRLHVISADYVFVPGPRFILLCKDLMRIIHPENSRAGP
jgi:ABC-type Fe3+-hydroxamate transport system substrate-binding protein